MVPGIWGPYYSAILKGFWLHEGGQSSVGSLIDHLITSHPAYAQVKTYANIYQFLEDKCSELKEKQGLPSIHHLTRDFHVLPDFHGNRSPLADPDLKGSMIGLALDQSEASLAITYLAAVQALAYGTKLIVDQLVDFGYKAIDQASLLILLFYNC